LKIEDDNDTHRNVKGFYIYAVGWTCW